MNFLLKIVEGPNKGAEVALVEGVAVTLGKGDDCDIVLADTTLPKESVSLEATPSGVTAGGELLEPLHVKTLGATSFAVGPADAPWGELVWPKSEAPEREAEEEKPEEKAAPPPEEKPADAGDAPAEKKIRRGGCLGCLVVLFILCAAIAVLTFFFRDRARPHAERLWGWTTNAVSGVCEAMPATGGDKPEVAPRARTLPDVIACYGLSATNRNARTVLVGNFATRAERLVATAEAYAAQPGVDLDFCDDESLKTAAEDTLALLSEKGLRVVAATNRVVALSGRAWRMQRTLEALASDLPKLRNVDVSDVTLASGVVAETEPDAAVGGRVDAPAYNVSRPSSALRLAPKSSPSLPVCGILTTPYPCLVLRSGARVLEGAAVGDSVVVKIEADAVTMTNAMGRFTWKP